MAIDLSTLFGQQPDYSAFLPDVERKRMQTNANQAALLNSAIALLAQSGRTTQPVSTQQALAGALSEAQKGYQSSMDRGMQELLTGLKIRESIGGKSPELSKEQQQYAFQRYGKSKFIDLDKTQQLDVLEFGQTPDINKALEQHIAAKRLKADTGIDLTDTTLENLKRAQRFTQSSPSPTAPNAPVVTPQIRNFKDK